MIRPHSPLTAELDFEDGRLILASDDTATAELIGGLAQGDVVAVGGRLRRVDWRDGDGRPRERLEIVAETVRTLYDARRARMVL